MNNPVVRAAAPSVVRVIGEACGLGITGSGWVEAPGVVVTAAHVVAGEQSTYVVQSDSNKRLPALVVGFDPRNDVAVLRVRDLPARPLPIADPVPGASVAIVGYPLNGPLDSVPGRIGQTASVLTDDAYGKGPVQRTVTSLGGQDPPRQPGGPAIDTAGRVELTVFAARVDADGGLRRPGRGRAEGARSP